MKSPKTPEKSDSRRPNLPIKEVLKNLQQEEEPRNSNTLNFTTLRNDGSLKNNSRYSVDSPSPKELSNTVAIKEQEIDITAGKLDPFKRVQSDKPKDKPKESLKITPIETKKDFKTNSPEKPKAEISEEMNKMADALTDYILQNLLKREIKDADRLIPEKCVYIQPPQNNNMNDSISNILNKVQVPLLL